MKREEQPNEKVHVFRFAGLHDCVYRIGGINGIAHARLQAQYFRVLFTLFFRTLEHFDIAGYGRGQLLGEEIF